MNLTFLRFMIRRHWLSVSLCLLAPIFIGVVMGLVYPAYSQQRESLSGLMQMLNLKEFFGGDQLDMFTPAGSFSMPLQHPLVLVICAVIASIAPIAIPAGERGKGLDLLLATPLTRGQIVITLAVFCTGVAILFGCAGLAGTRVAATMSGEVDAVSWGAFAVAALNLGTLCLIFGGIGMVVSVLARDRAQATLTIGAIVFVSLVLDVTARLWPAGKSIGYFTPYGYLRPAAIVGDKGDVTVGLLAALLMAGGASLLMVTALVIQVRRRSA